MFDIKIEGTFRLNRKDSEVFTTSPDNGRRSGHEWWAEEVGRYVETRFQDGMVSTMLIPLGLSNCQALKIRDQNSASQDLPGTRFPFDCRDLLPYKLAVVVSHLSTSRARFPNSFLHAESDSETMMAHSTCRSVLHQLQDFLLIHQCILIHVFMCTSSVLLASEDGYKF